LKSRGRVLFDLLFDLLFDSIRFDSIRFDSILILEVDRDRKSNRRDERSFTLHLGTYDEFICLLQYIVTGKRN
jgi:hypothetical protein